VNTTLDHLTDDPERWGLAAKLDWGEWRGGCARSMTGAIRRGGCVDLNYSLSRPVGGAGFRSETIRLRHGLGLYHGRIGLFTNFAYDVEKGYMQTAEYELAYQNQCSGVRLYYFTRKSLTLPSEDEFQFSIGLRNLGHFIKFRTRR
jgi:hypothetical protein